MSKHDRVTAILAGGIEMTITATRVGGTVSAVRNPANTITIAEHRGDDAKTVLRSAEFAFNALIAVVLDRKDNPVVIVYPEEA